jgi:hypothetical protein
MTHEEMAKEHLRQSVDANGSLGIEWDRSEHLTAALVHAVVAVNDTLKEAEAWRRKRPTDRAWEQS